MRRSRERYSPGLSHDLGREVTTRTAKPLLKALNIFPAEALDAAWRRLARKPQSQPSKRRVADDAIQVSSDLDAKDLGAKLWDVEIHIQSRNAIYKVLSDFHGKRSDADFFLRMLFSPVPVARAHAYGFFKKRGDLAKIWDYLVRKRVDQKSAPGMLPATKATAPAASQPRVSWSQMILRPSPDI